MTFEKIIEDAVDTIMNELGVDSIPREKIEEKVIKIINSGIYSNDEIVQTYLDNDPC